VGLLCLTLLAPFPARAGTDLTLGGVATVANTDGGFVLLRTDPSWDATVLTSLPEGTVVDVLDGPFSDAGGSAWYAVVAWGQEGFLPVAFLAGDATAADSDVQTSTEQLVDEGAVAADSDYVAASGDTAIIAGTNKDGARCRSEPSYAGGVITVLAEGEAVALNGWAEGEWQPVVCAGLAGYVHVDYVLIGGTSAPEPAPVEEAPAGEGTPPIAEVPPAAVDNPPADTTGYAVVVGTNGDGVRCRSWAGFDASTITVLVEGTEVALTGDPIDVWQPVACADEAGYVHLDYLSTGGATKEPAPTEDAAAAENAAAPEAAAPEGTGGEATFLAEALTGYAVVSGTNGGGLRCRSGAGYDASIITVLAEGTEVALQGSAQGEWQPVVCAGTSGFVHVDYLTYGNAGSSDDGTDGGDSGGSVSGYATVSGTNGDGVRCRSGAGYDASIYTVLPEGTEVALRGDASGAWQPVVCAGMDGYVHSDYLSYGGGGNDGGSDGGGSDGGGSDGGGGDVTGTAYVSGTNGDGVRCRSGASYNAGILVVLAEGTQVSLRGAAEGEWQPVVCAGTNGFVHSDYLSSSGGGSDDGGSDGGGSDDGGGTPSGSGLSVGDHAMTMASLNLRYDASFSAGVAAVAPSGTVVSISGGEVNGFYAVDWDGLSGYMHSDYLAWTDQPLSERGGSGDPGGGDPGTPGGGGGTATGQSIANFALQYVGYPYVWAGEGPYGFDCSGFVMFVIRNVLGMNITHDMFIQYDLGTPVAYGDLQPGDIVFFQNTFRWGMSHNGIYLGNGQFVHAENETTGVRISDINSQYYSSRYYGAVRFA
jgi:uncharacterized protein YraI